MASVCQLSAASASNSAIAGIRNASDKLDQAAADVARAGFQTEDRASLSDAARAPRDSAAGGTETGRLAGAMVDMRVAKYQQAASIAVLRTSDEMTKDVLSLGSSSRR